MWQEYDYLIDPHTAVAFDVLEQYRQETGDETPAIVASTASPFKFCDNVLSALGVTELAEGTGHPGPAQPGDRRAGPRPSGRPAGQGPGFTRPWTKDHMVDAVLEMLALKTTLELRMSLYAIGDTHLSLGVDKPMDVFGGGWEGYVEKLREGFPGSGRRTRWCCAGTCPGA